MGQGSSELISDYGAQRAIRPRCIGTIRAQTRFKSVCLLKCKRFTECFKSPDSNLSVYLNVNGSLNALKVFIGQVLKQSPNSNVLSLSLCPTLLCDGLRQLCATKFKLSRPCPRYWRLSCRFVSDIVTVYTDDTHAASATSINKCT
jgi:hypothetical protein